MLSTFSVPSFHTSGDFPVKLHFFSENEEYEILYVPLEQEILVDHVMKSIPRHDVLRLVVLENIQQAAKLSIEGVLAFCVVDDSGSVSYYGRR